MDQQPTPTPSDEIATLLHEIAANVSAILDILAQQAQAAASAAAAAAQAKGQELREESNARAAERGKTA